MSYFSQRSAICVMGSNAPKTVVAAVALTINGTSSRSRHARISFSSSVTFILPLNIAQHFQRSWLRCSSVRELFSNVRKRTCRRREFLSHFQYRDPELPPLLGSNSGTEKIEVTCCPIFLPETLERTLLYIYYYMSWSENDRAFRQACHAHRFDCGKPSMTSQIISVQGWERST